MSFIIHERSTYLFGIKKKTTQELTFLSISSILVNLSLYSPCLNSIETCPETMTKSIVLSLKNNINETDALQWELPYSLDD